MLITANFIFTTENKNNNLNANNEMYYTPIHSPFDSY